MKRKLTSILLLSSTICFSQTHINREWEISNGNPLGLEWSNSIVNSNNELVHVGNSAVAGEGANILTSKYNSDGNLIWQHSYNSSSNHNDYVVSLAEDNSGNVYVVGTTDNGSTTNSDVVVLKINSSGNLVWQTTFDSPYHKNDIGTAITLDDLGNVYVCGASEQSNTNTDYLILKYTNNGVFSWQNRYDFASMMEYPVGIDIDSDGLIFITGASASSINNWDFAIAKFSGSGNFIGDVRHSIPGIGYDQAYDFKKDYSGNILVTGTSSIDGVNYDIKTIKFDNTYNIEWVRTFDYAGKKDVGKTIDVDENGNVYVGGYVTKVNDVTEFFVLKYDTFGNEIWQHRHSGEDEMSDAFVKAIELNEFGEVYFIGEQKGLNGIKNTLVSKINESGNLEWQKNFESKLRCETNSNTCY